MCLNKELSFADNPLYIENRLTLTIVRNIINPYSLVKCQFQAMLRDLMKELPYFKFYVTEYLLDDISDQELSVQGLFINICAYYWFKDCSVSIAMLEKKFSNARGELETLIETGILKSSKGVLLENISIKFLDEQFKTLDNNHSKRVSAGAKGGSKKASNARAMLQQNPSYKNKNRIDKNNNYTDVFESFWLDIPKRSGSSKSQSFKIWKSKRIEQDKNLLNQIIESIPKYKKGVKTKYYAKVETWLNQERWTAEYSTPKNNNSRRMY